MRTPLLEILSKYKFTTEFLNTTEIKQCVQHSSNSDSNRVKIQQSCNILLCCNRVPTELNTTEFQHLIFILNWFQQWKPELQQSSNSDLDHSNRDSQSYHRVPTGKFLLEYRHVLLKHIICEYFPLHDSEYRYDYAVRLLSRLGLCHFAYIVHTNLSEGRFTLCAPPLGQLRLILRISRPIKITRTFSTHFTLYLITIKSIDSEKKYDTTLWSHDNNEIFAWNTCSANF